MSRKILIFVLCLIAHNTYAATGLSLAVGQGKHKVTMFRLGLQKHTDAPFRSKYAWHMSGYGELSAYQLRYHTGIAALAGVLRFHRGEPYATTTIQPYFELGVGPSWWTHRGVGQRNMGIHFQFEDRVGVGLRFGSHQQYDLGYRLVHFSNAHLSAHNPGMNFHMLVLGYLF